MLVGCQGGGQTGTGSDDEKIDVGGGNGQSGGNGLVAGGGHDRRR